MFIFPVPQHTESLRNELYNVFWNTSMQSIVFIISLKTDSNIKYCHQKRKYIRLHKYLLIHVH